MYLRYFGLQQAPFSIAPDPHYLFMSERHREALAHLLYGVRGGSGGFVVLTGEIGAGKTTVCRALLEQIPKRCNVAYIFNPKLTVEELLRTVCQEFRIPVQRAQAGAPSVKDYVDALTEYLLRTHAVGQNNVLIIDEAQNLSADVLEQLRLLTNLETAERKLLQIVLIGQPELRAMLARPQLAQLAQRVVARYHLGALSPADTERYIRHRLAVAGMTGAIPFDRAALRRIQLHSRGIPRRINLLADRALLGAYATGKTVVDAAIVDKAAREVFHAADFAARRRARLERAAVLGVGLAAGVALFGLAVLAGGIGLGGPPAVAGSASDKTPAPVTEVPIAVAAAAPVGARNAPEAKTLANVATEFEALLGNEREAWRELAAAWRLAPGEGDVCQAVRRQQLQCYKSGTATLGLIRQLDRPGILTLRDGRNRTVYAVLVGLGKDDATLRAGGRAITVSLHALADYWRGEFATFWRTPPGYEGTIGDGSGGPMAQWLAAQLAALRGETQGTPAAALRARIYAFQMAQGLTPDGIAGPVTLMALNRALGVDEPRLQEPQ
jgi:general secretion pathway protein A